MITISLAMDSIRLIESENLVSVEGRIKKGRYIIVELMGREQIHVVWDDKHMKFMKLRYGGKGESEVLERLFAPRFGGRRRGEVRENEK